MVLPLYIKKELDRYITKIEKEFDVTVISAFITGSRLYGTFNDESDYDIRGVFIPNKKQYLGFVDNINQLRYENKELNVDFEFTEFKKFLILCLNNNPNIVEYLFINPENIIYSTNIWKSILINKQYFLCKKAKHTFTGYAISQIKRLKSHRNWLLCPPTDKPNRKDFGLPETHKLITSEQIGAYNQLVVTYLKQVGKFHKLRDKLEKMNESIDYISILNQCEDIDYNSVNKIYPTDNNFMVALQLEKNYNNSLTYWKQYQSWKQQRNPRRQVLEKKFGYDTKHMMHCFRLLWEGEELLLKENITFPRPEKKQLSDIRDGKYSYDELIKEIENLEYKFQLFYDESRLHKQPNRNKINELCIDILSDFCI